MNAAEKDFSAKAVMQNSCITRSNRKIAQIIDNTVVQSFANLKVRQQSDWSGILSSAVAQREPGMARKENSAPLVSLSLSVNDNNCLLMTGATDWTTVTP